MATLVSVTEREADVSSDLGFDPDTLRAKYRAERDRRLRADGNEQYVEVTGDFAHYLEDPYVTPALAARLYPTIRTSSLWAAASEVSSRGHVCAKRASRTFA